MTEIVPGIHRIESVLGPRPFSQYLLRGTGPAARSLLFDTGCADTPETVILPFLRERGWLPDIVLASHADVDHYGGNAAIRAAAPSALLLAHADDVRWMESKELILRERYGWYDAHGLAYPPEVFQWLADALGPDVPVDVRLHGGEQIRLGDELVVEVLHLPGHSPGHIGLWEPASRTAIVMDAVLGRGLLDTEGKVIHPPPVFDIPGYRATAAALLALDPHCLLTAHYAPMWGADAHHFLEESLAFMDDLAVAVEEELAAAGMLTLAELLERCDPRLGPFTSMPNELAGSLRAYARELCAAGRAAEGPTGLSWSWTSTK